MRKADFKKEGILSEASFRYILRKKLFLFQDLLKVSNHDDILELFDQDEDGMLKAEEQIMIFTLIKLRIEIIAEKANELKKYEVYKDLICEVREIESLINKFQNELRTNEHRIQMESYIKKGEELQILYNNEWEHVFNNFVLKRDNETKTKEESIANLNDPKIEKLVKRIEGSKINKLKYKISLLSKQEKLVATNERTEEAINFRTELKNLKKMQDKIIRKHNNLIETKINSHNDKQKNGLMNNMNEDLKTTANLMLIQRDKASDLFNKKINLHVKDLESYQNSIASIYSEKGKKQEELKREKIKQIKTNNILKQNKITINTDNNFEDLISSNTIRENFSTFSTFNFNKNPADSNFNHETLSNTLFNKDNFDLAFNLLNIPIIQTIPQNTHHTDHRFITPKSQLGTRPIFTGIDFTSSKVKTEHGQENLLTKIPFTARHQPVDNTNRDYLNLLKILIKNYNNAHWNFNSDNNMPLKDFCNVKNKKEIHKCSDYKLEKAKTMKNKINKLLNTRQIEDTHGIAPHKYYDEDLNEINNELELNTCSTFKNNTELLPAIHIYKK